MLKKNIHRHSLNSSHPFSSHISAISGRPNLPSTCRHLVRLTLQTRIVATSFESLFVCGLLWCIAPILTKIIFNRTLVSGRSLFFVAERVSGECFQGASPNTHRCVSAGFSLVRNCLWVNWNLSLSSLPSFSNGVFFTFFQNLSLLYDWLLLTRTGIMDRVAAMLMLLSMLVVRNHPSWTIVLLW